MYGQYGKPINCSPSLRELWLTPKVVKEARSRVHTDVEVENFKTELEDGLIQRSPAPLSLSLSLFLSFSISLDFSPSLIYGHTHIYPMIASYETG